MFWDVGAAVSRVQIERRQRVVLGEGHGYRRRGDGRGCERGSDGQHGRIGVALSDGIEVRDYGGFERSLLAGWVVPVRGRDAEQQRRESDCAHLLRLPVGSCRELRDQHAVERGALQPVVLQDERSACRLVQRGHGGMEHGLDGHLPRVCQPDSAVQEDVHHRRFV